MEAPPEPVVAVALAALAPPAPLVAPVLAPLVAEEPVVAEDAPVVAPVTVLAPEPVVPDVTVAVPDPVVEGRTPPSSCDPHAWRRIIPMAANNGCCTACWNRQETMILRLLVRVSRAFRS